MPSPAAERNREPIREVLAKYLAHVTGSKTVLEVSSGDGTHVSHFARTLPSSVAWHPTEYDEQLLGLISANAAGLENVSAPARLDVTEESAYPEDSSFDYIFNANMVHISEWRCTEGLFKLAGKVLRRGHGTGLLFLYGPFAVDGVLEPESNVRFDSILRERNPGYGVRDVADLKVLAAKNGLELKDRYEMPANNKILVWVKK